MKSSSIACIAGWRGTKIRSLCVFLVLAIRAFASAEFKTGGWVAGCECTAAHASFSAGLRARF